MKRTLRIDNKIYEVDDERRTIEYKGLNLNWIKLSEKENAENKKHVEGYKIILKIDKGIFEVNDKEKTFRYKGKNPEWERLSEKENEENKLRVQGYEKILVGGRRIPFHYKELLL